MQPINILALAIALSGLSLAAPTSYNSGASSELRARDLEREVLSRNVESSENDFSTLSRREAWTRAQEAALQRARAEYGRLNALRGHPGFNQAAWLHAQQEYNGLQAAKTANGSRVNARSMEFDEDESLAARAAWTRSQEAALQRARAEYGRLNALRGHPGFNQATWLHAQQEYNRLQAAKTANGSRVNTRSVELDEDETLAARAAWTRSQEAALQRARAEYGRLNALRGHPGFDQAAWLRAQQEYNRLQAAKTANGSRVRDLESLEELD
ncbi:hypothetical protein CALVIDRAFT_563405 [Calocera viscosa TUFC12733]|uniref:Uncharacterized protein n=1 Tax=Calocera viscosa (strain TUFC12733) TaxID=1330018 RepID=A0A167MZY8_CALVF|nr:hypothetical protein CALVIDRAFT_563405 [Calocera viscosa TUFC12733]